MVKKSCKRGVHSGNTLRASSSLYKRRYHGDSCIVRRLQSGCEEVEDSYLRDNDVLYSLNKKGRWLLPQLLINNIVKGLTLEGSAATTPVSFLQRHKLKRQANCVAVASTWGRCRRRPVTGRTGLYFNGRSVLDAGRGRRRRARRGQAAREAQARPDLQGEQHAQPEAQVRYEAFLPCSASSSLSHNPKYILKPEWADAGVFPEAKVPGKKLGRGKARRRKTTLQWMDVAMEMEALDFQEHLDDTHEEEDVDLHNEKEAARDVPGVSDTRLSLEELIQSAEKARDLCDRPGQHVAGREPRRRRHTSFGETERPGKVIHVDRDQAAGDEAEQAVASSPSVSATPASPEVESVPVRVILPDCEVVASELSRLYEGRYLEAACQPRRFILDLSEELEARAGGWETVGSVRARDLDLTAYLVFTYDAFYDAGLSVYGVALQVKTRLQRVRLETLWELSVSSVAAVLEAALAYVSMLGVQALVPREAEAHIAEAPDRSLTFQHVRRARREVMDAFHPEEAVSKVVRDLALSQDADIESDDGKSSSTELAITSDDGNGREGVPLLPENAGSHTGDCDEETTVKSQSPVPGLAAGVDPFPDEEPQFCNICFVEVGTGIPDAPGVTWLRACAHVFCDDCWRRHLAERVTSGAGKLLCPEFRCEAEVDAGTVLSLLSLSQVRQWRRRQVEVSVTRAPGQTWCPNPRCGRVLRLRGRGLGGTGGVQAVSVACVCGWTTCLACGREAHWPATCVQERHYRERLATRGDLVFSPRNTANDVKVMGKNCPSCKTFIEKNGGCTCMVCRCGHTFCWQCLKKWWCNSDVCYTKDDNDTAKSVRVRHEEQKREESEAYMMALHHRTQRSNEEVKSLKATAARLGWRLRRAEAEGEDVGLHLLEDPRQAAPGRDHVTGFLQDVLRLKLELHHVAEHTAILLEDGVAAKDRRRVRGLLERLLVYSHSLATVLATEGRAGLPHVLPRLLALQRLAGAALRALVRTLHTVSVAGSPGDQ